MQYEVGQKIKLNGKLYSNSQTHCGLVRFGDWYVYDGKVINGRIRVTNKPDRVGKLPISVNISGYVNPDDIMQY